MTHDVANSVLASAIALRVFIPGALVLARRLLGAGVRVGAAVLLERHLGTPLAAPGKDVGRE